MGKKSLLTVITIFYVMFVLSGCNDSRIKEKKFHPKNPTSYVFNVGKNELEKGVVTIFSDHYQRKKPFPLNFVENGDRFIIENDSISIGNKISSMKISSWPWWLSEYHYYKNKPLKIQGSYMLTIEDKLSNKTKVTITKNKLTVYLGSSILSKYISVRGGGNFEEVESSTIEEYVFLHSIGDYFNNPMPKIQRPSN